MLIRICPFLVVIAFFTTQDCFAWQSKTEKASPRTSIVFGELLPEEGGPKTPAAARLKSPFGIDFDRNGLMYIVELSGGRVHTLTLKGKLATIGGQLDVKDYQGDGGPVSKARFNGMHNVAVAPDGSIYIADSWNHCIRKLSPKTKTKPQTISTVAGTGEAGFSGDGGPAKDAKFNFVMCISLNPSNDMIHVADLKNRRIRAFDLKSGLVSTIAGNGKKAAPKEGGVAVDNPLVDPRAVAADSKGNVYVLERGAHSLRVIRKDGTIHTVLGTGKPGKKDGPAKKATLKSPKHIAIDGMDRVIIADEANGLIRRYAPKSQTVTTLLGGGIGTPPIKLSRPHGVCVEDGKLYVVDTGHNRILRIESE